MLTEAFRPAAMSFFAETVEPARRKSAFAVYRLAINLGMAIGPAIGGILATIAFRYLFFVDGATSIAAGLVLAGVGAPERQKKAARTAGAPAPTTATRLRLSTAAHADPRFLFFLAGVLPVDGHLLPAHLVDAALHRRTTSASRRARSASSSRSTAC